MKLKLTQEKQILVRLPQEIETRIRIKSHDEVADVNEELKGKTLDEIIKTMKDKLYAEKCEHKSAIYFKDKEIKNLTTIIEESAT
jgi:hypothetical protein